MALVTLTVHPYEPEETGMETIAVRWGDQLAEMMFYFHVLDGRPVKGLGGIAPRA